MKLFADLIKEWETNPERAELLRQGREWICREFYDQPRPRAATEYAEAMGLPTDFPR